MKEVPRPVKAQNVPTVTKIGLRQACTTQKGLLLTFRLPSVTQSLFWHQQQPGHMHFLAQRIQGNVTA